MADSGKGVMFAVVALVMIGGAAVGGVKSLLHDPNDVPMTSTDEIANVLEKVDSQNPENTWWPHVTGEVDDSFIADISIPTDYSNDDPQVKELCEAVLAAAGDPDILINIRGFRTISETQVDGSKDVEQDETVLMNGTKDSGCFDGLRSGDKNS